MADGLEAEIRRINTKYVLFRYLTFKIDSSGLPKTIIKFNEELGIGSTQFTPAAMDTIVRFVDYAVSVYNDQHPDMPTSSEEAWEVLWKNARDDELALLKERTIPI